MPGRHLDDLKEEVRRIRAEHPGEVVPLDKAYAGLEGLVLSHEDIFLGKVLDASTVPATEAEGVSPSDELYKISVRDPLVSGTLATGDSLKMLESWVTTRRDLLLRVGETYLFFLDAEGSGEIALVPLTTFTVDECGRVQARTKPQGTDLEKLNGLRLGDAESFIRERLAETSPTP